MLNELLIDLSRASQGNVEASAIISKSQGLTICTHYPEGTDDARIPDEDVIAGRSTQIQEATRKVFKQLKRGPLVHDAILSALTNKRANIGYMFFMMTRIAKKVEKVLS
jgi:predicted regulator of Ras-like GTPase activity (Roadblock/LC7/MglB family)